MKQFLKFSNMHLFFPRVIACILAILGIAIIVQRVLKCKKDGTPFINLKGYRFFKADYDKIKLWGSVILFAAYIACLEPLGFLWASMIFVFLFNVLFAESINLKALFGKEKAPVVDVKNLLTSVAIAVISSTLIWFLFYKIFNITLP